MSGYYNQQPGGYPPQQPQQGYGYQQPGYPPPQGFQQLPPFQQGGYQQPPPQQGFGGFVPPPGPPPGRAPQGYGAPPPPGPPPGQFAPPQGQFPPPHQQNFGPVPMASPGYDPNMRAQGDARADSAALRKAMKGFGTDEKVLINVLSKPDPLQINLLRTTYHNDHRRDLEKDIVSETSGYFRDALVAIVRGPLIQDVNNVHNAIKGLGTKETMLNDVLLGRSNADMRAIKQHYHQIYKKSMEQDVSEDLSLKTESLFKMVMAATRSEENVPIMPDQIARDVHDLYSAMRGMGTDQTKVCGIISSRSDGQIRAIAQQFEQRYQTTLEKKVKSDFSGHMQDALVLMVQRATDRAMTDATQMEEAMAGMGTKDTLLLNRVVSVHWNRQHMDQVKRAYAHRYKKDLVSRVRGETSGDYERLLVACLT